MSWQQAPGSPTKGQVSLIIPCRNCSSTIGKYFPVLERLYIRKIIHEIILINNSSDNDTQQTILDGLKQAPHLLSATREALQKSGTKSGSSAGAAPVKLLDVYHPQIRPIVQQLLPAIPLNKNTPMGHGSAIYTGLALATCPLVAYLDADFQNISEKLISSLITPMQEEHMIAVRSTYGLEDLLPEDTAKYPDKIWNSVCSRLLVKPIYQLLHQQNRIHFVHRLRGPISAGLGIYTAMLKSFTFLAYYGMATSHIVQLDSLLRANPAATMADMYQGLLFQQGQAWHGKESVAEHILNTFGYFYPAIFTPKLADQYQDLFLTNAITDEDKKFAKYLHQKVQEFIQQRHENKGTKASSIKNRTINEVVLQPLNKNNYYLKHRQELLQMAGEFTLENE